MKQRKKRRGTIGYFIGLFGLLLLGVGAFALYGLINQSASDLLFIGGIKNYYLQSSIVVLVVLIGLVLSGGGFYYALEKLIKGN